MLVYIVTIGRDDLRGRPRVSRYSIRPVTKFWSTKIRGTKVTSYANGGHPALIAEQ